MDAELNEAKQMPATAETSGPRHLGPPVTMSSLSGEREFLRGPLTRDSGYRLMVSGEIGTKELGKIIKILTLQRELLSETDEESEERQQ